MNKKSYTLTPQINFITVKNKKYIKKSGFNPFNSIYNNQQKIIPENIIDFQDTKINDIKNEVKNEVNNNFKKKISPSYINSTKNCI